MTVLETPVQTECLRLEQLPQITPLFRDFMLEPGRVSRFFPRPTGILGWAAEERKRVWDDPLRRERIASILDAQNRRWGSDEEVHRNIERLRKGAAAIVTGHQVGLFGGPTFSIYKAVSVLRLAKELTRQGIETVPIFWLATDDHDVAEVDHTTILSAEDELFTYKVPTESPEHAPVAHVRLGRDVAAMTVEVGRILGDESLSELLSSSYAPGERLGDAFARLASQLFAGTGVILLDAADPELHSMAAPVFRAAVIGAADLDTALLERGKQLTGAGYHEQVHVTPSSTLLFMQRDSARTPVHRANGKFEAGGELLGESDLVQRIISQPELFSANVLLRPVVQDFLLPTLAYVGGPAEVAYFAQAAVAYEQLLGRVTPILPRYSATIVELHVKRLLERQKFTVADAFVGEEALLSRISEQHLPPGLNQQFESATQQVERSVAEVRESLAKLDSTLVRSADKARTKILHELTRLHGRAGRSEARRNQELAHQARRISNALYPEGHLQERVINGLSFVSRLGPQFVRNLVEHADISCPDHQVLYF